MDDATRHELIVDFCTQSLDASAADRLDDLLDADAQAREEFLEQWELHRLLQAELMPAPDHAPSIRQSLARRLAWRRIRHGLMAAAAVLLLAVGLWRWQAMPPERIAWGRILTGGTALRTPLDDGSSLPIGRELQVLGTEPLRLRDRLGATVTVPTGGRLRTTSTGLELLTGSLAAVVPPRSQDVPLIVTAPGARYRILGTRFTILAGEGVSRLQVQSGQVAVLGGGVIRRVVSAGGSVVSGHRPLPEPVLHLDFEQRQGRELHDRSPLAHRAWMTQAAPPVPGRFGTGLACDRGRVLLVADHPALLPDHGTLALWLRPRIPLPAHELDAPGMPVEFFSKADWASRSGLEVLRPAHGPERWGLRLMTGDGSTAQLMLPTDQRTDWIHLALTWGDGEARMYIDGRLAGRTALPPISLPAVATDLRIGNNFLGTLDEVRLYPTVLDAVQVAAVMLAADH